MDRGQSVHRDWLIERMRRAIDRVNEGERLIARHREIVLELERLGECSARAGKLLGLYEELQQMRIADRDRLYRQLKDLDTK